MELGRWQVGELVGVPSDQGGGAAVWKVESVGYAKKLAKGESLFSTHNRALLGSYVEYRLEMD